ncbi:MAG: zinc-binding dehydrogenase [candidate division NC10 bacterium]|nr:zinc-binding dehydrogenase [candidate division NC10 bacterium]
MKTQLGPGNVEIREVSQPEPGPGEVLIEVRAAGICGTDLHIWKDEYKSVPPMIMGHESSGVIAALGQGVEGLAVGDRVTSETFAKFCGRCFFCLRGKPNLCPERKSIGTHLNGVFTKYLTIRASAVHRLPDLVSFWAGALSEPLACCVHGILERTPVTAGDWVVISGPGTIGLLALQLVKADGGKAVVLGTDQDEERLALAKRLGADEAINVQRQDPLPLVQERTGGLGADLAIECAGAAASFQQCLKLTRKAGRISQGGLFGKPVTSDLELIAMKELEVIGFFSHVPSAWDRALKLMAEGKVLTEPLVTHRLPLSEWKRGFSLMEKGEGIKILLLPED